MIPVTRATLRGSSVVMFVGEMGLCGLVDLCGRLRNDFGPLTNCCVERSMENKERRERSVKHDRYGLSVDPKIQRSASK